MSLLFKIGQIVLKATQIVTGFAPVITAMQPGSAGTVQTISRDLAEISAIITQVEVIGQTLSLPGAQKLQAATPLVAQVILSSAMLANHKIAQPELFQTGCKKIADGMADCMNSLNESGMQATDKT